ncbi:MAG TPA: N-acetyl-gamma-glutamyl-phosphate reductase [Candidatus Limnocylindria bacterium]|jgi:N-acetyl-gamma-glutamyl-phosphate reductase|nr:N-acetyl-gamma-glutamyl-phosphate reductase [Candidatus Limnocylindria bacterium]
MITAHVVGASGYAAAELIRLLDRHPSVALGVLESRSSAGRPVGDVFPWLPHLHVAFEESGTTLARVREDDVVFIAGGHELAREQAPLFLSKGARVIDLSDAFRLHANAGEAVYGFPERYRDRIAQARLIANPGCYVTASLLALVPLAPLADRIAQIVIDAKSGITGAGRNPSVGAMFAEVDGDVRAYGLTGHRHGAEIVQEARAAGIEAPIIFSPHVVPLKRGILADVYLIPRAPLGRDEVLAAYERFYAANPFITVFRDVRAPHLPALEGTNDAHLAVAERDGVVHVLSALDNLGKGAAAQAIQNMNLVLGLPEEQGLDARTTVG